MRYRGTGLKRRRRPRFALWRDSDSKLSFQLLVDGGGAGDSVAGNGTGGDGEPSAPEPVSLGWGGGADGRRRLCSRTAATAATDAATMIKPRIEYGFVKSPMTKASPDGGLVYTMDIRCCDRARSEERRVGKECGCEGGE